jgi:hypothetical protein
MDHRNEAAAQREPRRTIPQYAVVSEWLKISGMSRSGTYLALGRGDLRGKKLGRTLLIDVPHGLVWLDSLPPARIRPAA